MRALRQRTRASAQDDQGVALIAVILSMAILSLFLLSSLAYVLQGTRPARADQDAKTAIAAAEAGIDEYVSRLNADTNYVNLGNFPGATALDTTNLAFTGAGQVIQGTGLAGARYRYTQLTTAVQTAQNGVIRLRVTGYSTPSSTGVTVSRTLTVALQPKGFLSYVYLSDLEVVDPSLAGNSSTCLGRYHYAIVDAVGAVTTPARTSSACSEIQWTGGDTVRGPLHSNDALQINGAVNFTSVKTETSCPSTITAAQGACKSPTWWGTQTGGLGGFSPKYALPIALPESNSELLANVEPDVDGNPATPVGPGCYYTGATRITLSGTQMKVLSPATTRTDTPSRCYKVSTPGVEQTVDIPPVVYIDSTSNACTLGAVGYPAAGEKYSAGTSTAASWGSTTNYDCSRGSLYIQGTANDQVTFAANDDVVVTADLGVTGTTAGTNVVGLIAGNYVWVYHPLKSSNSANLLTTPVLNVQAAILALRHSFVVQNWATGSALGTLNVVGSISQKYRGPVGTGSGSTISTGYYKNYVYDTRLSYLQPPFFLKVKNSPWQVATVTDG